MITDAQGQALSGATREAAQHFDQAVTAFNLYRGDPIAALDAALALAPRFAMAALLKAHLMAVATEPAATQAARGLLATVAGWPLNGRERSHLAAATRILDGEWSAAAVLLDRHHIEHPFDIVALQVGHLVDFFRANARSLRDRIARTLPQWAADRPGRGLLLGMHAFGLEECGQYAEAEDAAHAALSAEPRDCWAHHAVAHVMEMQARHEDGIDWARVREPYWTGADNFFQVHNWWHRALCHIEVGQADQALALYDSPIRSGRSAVAVDMVDASALLWRLHLEGHEIGDRWQELATAWDAHADGRSYAFNDWHAAMAWLGAGREAEVRALEARLRHAGERGEAARWAVETGADLVAGFAAFWNGDFERSIDCLWRARPIANRFGGSHAQRDVIDWTLTEAALRGGQRALAEALAHERLALRPDSSANRAFLRRALALVPSASGEPAVRLAA
ncbi:MAG: tetratricopeptide repeat protein [Hydrogenophaga sp.]|uniref:tetratricopeptide repeat protein n=1 Tax=Hydrogenophaga sp. TaxID=1904254 RepID=UPI0016ABF662|nr:tetratricopeptide repeat protein [Hydrogenophaga sp.]NIM41823.1 tetratricopeptide repeat protein [Hydrogenophaga sp.]NIN27128.1 tetratricopeptide repeat protein [Hydrogenophaga sp.]NIN31829.1 tetratricopeptide repeat protein [Hydrogenophaga sp.]NIN56073.1 tetratricopeptide repeat protein [Hydrogenophaga sp.]NIO52200.1 tetratricopeptide repeat protein [Hydrogenophaga sp.]